MGKVGLLLLVDVVVGVTAAERLLTLWGTVSLSTSVSVAVGRHRCPPTANTMLLLLILLIN
ncbi:hypothetical protein T4E_2499 [Trichinella pseudospiralis]|uniref:Uncharacterized protein n=1 Tax=Trichinella pseudospiralis TaxID=6337 RepID=A0A0V0XWG0_TRIPS|nr:hypothetical protein T4E_7754 [Trichinella pseudospiralis]KRX92407.1 hypothetical protein T4E_2499 [Trichinella pseudospiralis]